MSGFEFVISTLQSLAEEEDDDEDEEECDCYAQASIAPSPVADSNPAVRLVAARLDVSELLA